MAHAIRIMPESKEAQAILEAEQRHTEVLENAVTNFIGTMPRVFRTIKHGLKYSEVDNSFRDLGEQQIWLLYALAKERQLTSELARTFNVTMPTITRSVDTLVEKGIVERQPDPKDRRCIYLQLTSKGISISDNAHAQFRTAVSKFFAPLTEEQLQDLAAACQHISKLLPEGLYDYESACPANAKPGALEELGKEAAARVGSGNTASFAN